MKEKIKCYCGHTTTCECGEEPKQDLEKEMFELEQQLDIPSNLRWHNSKPKQEIPQIGTKEFNDLASAYFGGKPKQETLEEVAYNYAVTKTNRTSHLIGFREGAKWQQERSYSEEEVIQLLYFRSIYQDHFETNAEIIEWFNKFKKK